MQAPANTTPAATPIAPRADAHARDVAGSGESAAGRVIAIDIIRGFAILWVIVFHLYVDMTFHLNGAEPLYTALRDRIGEGRVLPALQALGEVILGQGYMGVGVFMFLSGLSLTMNAYRRPPRGRFSGYVARFRRIIVAYWGGVLILVGTIAVIALLQMLIDGGSYAHQWWNVRIGVINPVNVHWEDVAWALSVFFWQFRTNPVTVPVGSLWFVELLLQYYLIFPFALIALKKIGPWNFAAAGLALVVVTRAIFIYYGPPTFDNGQIAHYMESLSLFRASEFFLGMSLGHLLVHRREQIATWVESPLDVAGLILIGSLFVTAGTLMSPDADLRLAASEGMVEIGLATLMLPLLFKRPGRLEVSLVARALVFLGIVSFTALIVDDAMRYVASFLRYEGLSGAGWWLFVVVVYVPVGTLIAYPLARLFRLLPDQRERPPGARAPVPAVEPELQPAGAG